jgi:hypothetical protein
MPVKIKDTVKIQARIMFIEQGMKIEDISKHLGGQPCTSTIGNWTNEKDKEGKTWKDHRQVHLDNMYLQMSPGAMADNIFDRIKKMLLDKDMDSSKFADALHKMNLSIAGIVDPKLQIPVMYQLLEDQVEFARLHYPDFFKDDFREFVIAFKNHIRARLEG